MRECTQTHTHTHTHTSSLIYTYANIPRYMCLPPTLVVSIWCAPTGPRQDLCGHPGAAPRPARRGVAAAAGGHHRRPGAHRAPPDRPPDRPLTLSSSRAAPSFSRREPDVWEIPSGPGLPTDPRAF